MKHKQIWEKVSLCRIFVQNFLAGIGWGLGATVGVVILLGAASWVFSFLGGLPIVGGFLAESRGVNNIRNQVPYVN